MQELAQALAMVSVPAALGVWTVAMIDLGLYSPRYFLPVASGLFYTCCITTLYATYVLQRVSSPSPTHTLDLTIDGCAGAVKSDGCISADAGTVLWLCSGIYASQSRGNTQDGYRIWWLGTRCVSARRGPNQP